MSSNFCLGVFVLLINSLELSGIYLSNKNMRVLEGFFCLNWFSTEN